MFIEEEAVCRLHPIGCYVSVSCHSRTWRTYGAAPGSGVASINIALLRTAPFTGLPLGISKNFEEKPFAPFLN